MHNSKFGTKFVEIGHKFREVSRSFDQFQAVSGLPILTSEAQNLDGDSAKAGRRGPAITKNRGSGGKSETLTNRAENVSTIGQATPGRAMAAGVITGG